MLGLGLVLAWALGAGAGCQANRRVILGQQEPPRTIAMVGDRPVSASSGTPGSSRSSDQARVADGGRAEVSGRVYDDSDRPVANARVRVVASDNPRDSYTVATDRRGVFSLTNLRSDVEYTIQAESPDGGALGRARVRTPEYHAQVLLTERAPRGRVSAPSGSGAKDGFEFEEDRDRGPTRLDGAGGGAGGGSGSGSVGSDFEDDFFEDEFGPGGGSGGRRSRPASTSRDDDDWWIREMEEADNPLPPAIEPPRGTRSPLDDRRRPSSGTGSGAGAGSGSGSGTGTRGRSDWRASDGWGVNYQSMDDGFPDGRSSGSGMVRRVAAFGLDRDVPSAGTGARFRSELELGARGSGSGSGSGSRSGLTEEAAARLVFEREAARARLEWELERERELRRERERELARARVESEAGRLALERNRELELERQRRERDAELASSGSGLESEGGAEVGGAPPPRPGAGAGSVPPTIAELERRRAWEELRRPTRVPAPSAPASGMARLDPRTSIFAEEGPIATSSASASASPSPSSPPSGSDSASERISEDLIAEMLGDSIGSETQSQSQSQSQSDSEVEALAEPAAAPTPSASTSGGGGSAASRPASSAPSRRSIEGVGTPPPIRAPELGAPRLEAAPDPSARSASVSVSGSVSESAPATRARWSDLPWEVPPSVAGPGALASGSGSSGAGRARGERAAPVPTPEEEPGIEIEGGIEAGGDEALAGDILAEMLDLNAEAKAAAGAGAGTGAGGLARADVAPRDRDRDRDRDRERAGVGASRTTDSQRPSADSGARVNERFAAGSGLDRGSSATLELESEADSDSKSDSSAAAGAPRRRALPAPKEFAAASCKYNSLTRTLIDFQLPDLRGRPVRLAEIPSEYVLLDFWGTWCVPCRTSIPKLSELQRKYGSARLRVVGIAYEPGDLASASETVSEAIEPLGIRYPVLLGDYENCPVRERLNVTLFPTMVLIDGKGRIVWRGQGARPEVLSELEEVLTKRLAAPASSASEAGPERTKVPANGRTAADGAGSATSTGSGGSGNEDGKGGMLPRLWGGGARPRPLPMPLPLPLDRMGEGLRGMFGARN